MRSSDDHVNTLSQMALFADLARPQLEAAAQNLEEQIYSEGTLVLRQGSSGGGLYVVVDGEAAVNVDGNNVAKLSRGDFFGEISCLLDESPSADVVASTELRCLVLPGPELREFLLSNPKVCLRMLQAEAARLRDALRLRD